MIDCLVIGDSIAEGFHRYRPECVIYAKTGITTSGWNKLFNSKDLTAKIVIISLGSNNSNDIWSDLVELRKSIVAEKVFWIMPNIETKKNQANTVIKVAQLSNDNLISTDRYYKDKIHPTMIGYKELAQQTK